MGPIKAIVENVMLPFLTFSYENIFPNYGVSIILLTVLIKIIFFPLTKKQFHSMKIMQKLKPKLQEIQKKYKKQPEKLQKEMMQLYKDNKVNPLGGCLPLLIQLPFLFALYYTINSDGFSALIAQPGINPGLFSFWLPNLGMPDRFYILPLLIGLSAFYSQKLTITDEKQAKMMMFMPLIMFVICLNLPSGVLLYWAASQIISTGQQILVMKENTT
ncbi:MAG: membrane protein insertase YidC [Candidatus Margulisbacteria bacterium]|nr:membrane protein insertase YidC [Candidatus Margulisiibacteriota bacterium]